jgi:hypothetical protein
MENEKDYFNISLNEHKSLVDLSGDKNPIHTIQNYIMGAHLLGLIEIHPEIKNQYIQHLEVGFPSPVIMKEGGNKLMIKVDKLSEPSTHLYSVEIKENNIQVLRGKLKTTDNFEMFRLESKTMLESCQKTNISDSKVAYLKITPEKLDAYKRLIYSKTMTSQEYDNKFKDNRYPSMFTTFFIYAEIIKILEQHVKNLNNGKKYLFAGSALDFYTPGVSDGDLKLIGKIPEDIGTRSKCHIDFLVSGLEGIVAKSRTLAMAKA